MAGEQEPMGEREQFVEIAGGQLRRVFEEALRRYPAGATLEDVKRAVLDQVDAALNTLNEME